MSIKGLTHRPVRPEILARLYKGGEMVESGDRRMPGRDLGTSFRFASDNPAVEAAFVAAFGSLVVSDPIPCLLAGASVDDAWHTERAVWGQTGLVRACDGEHMTAWRNAEGYIERGEAECMAPKCYVQKAKQEDGSYKDEWRQCPASGRLDLVLPALTEAGFYGVVRLATHGEIDVRVIDASLRRLTVLPWSRVVDDCGGLFNVPFEICRVEEDINYVQAGTKRTRKLGVVQLKQVAPPARALAGAVHGGPLLSVDDDVTEGEDVVWVDTAAEEPFDNGAMAVEMTEDTIVDEMMQEGVRISDLANLVNVAGNAGWVAAQTLGSDLLVAKVKSALPKIQSPDTCSILLVALNDAMEGTPGLEDLKNALTKKQGELVLNSL